MCRDGNQQIFRPARLNRDLIKRGPLVRAALFPNVRAMCYPAIIIRFPPVATTDGSEGTSTAHGTISANSASAIVSNNICLVPILVDSMSDHSSSV